MCLYSGYKCFLQSIHSEYVSEYGLTFKLSFGKKILPMLMKCNVSFFSFSISAFYILSNNFYLLSASNLPYTFLILHALFCMIER